MPIPSQVRFQIDDSVWSPGVRLAFAERRPDLLPGFARYMAKICVMELRRAIRTQRYKTTWEPLSVHYSTYKIQKDLSLNTWEATGHLINSITWWEQGDYYVVGIKPSTSYPSNPGLKVSKVAKFLEYGTEKMPARPLFRPLFQYLKKHIRTFWSRYLAEVGQKRRVPYASELR
jgi:hypothetical protein